VIPVMCRKVDMLSEVERRKKRHELRSKMISRIDKVDIEVASYYKFTKSGGSKRWEFIKVTKESVVADGICGRGRRTINVKDRNFGLRLF